MSHFLSRQEEDVDFLAKFSRLVNGMGQSLVLSWTKLAKTGSAKDAAETLQAMEAKVPLLLQLLVHEDDDISANIVSFCYEYLHVLKQVRPEASSGPIGVHEVRKTEKILGQENMSGSVKECQVCLHSSFSAVLLYLT